MFAFDAVAVLLEELGLGEGTGFYGCEEGFEVRAGVVAEVAVAGFTEVFELFVAAVPAVAVFIVFSGCRSIDVVPAGNAGDVCLIAPPPHT